MINSSCRIIISITVSFIQHVWETVENAYDKVIKKTINKFVKLICSLIVLFLNADMFLNIMQFPISYFVYKYHI